MKNLVSSIGVALLVSQTAMASEFRKINGTVTVPAGQTVNSASTVNGSVRIGERANVGEAETVNGSIQLAKGAVAGSLETVNGAVEVGEGAQVSGNIETVNGKLTVRANATVGGNIENVNGDIDIAQAHVKGRIETINADLNIGAQAKVDGGILYRKPKLDWSSDRRPPRVVIGPGATIGGSLTFEREVQLYVSDTAKIGQVTGAKPTRFTGPTPPG